MKKNKPTLEGFTAFVESRGSDEKIDHSCNINNCAMGMYWESIGRGIEEKCKEFTLYDGSTTGSSIFAEMSKVLPKVVFDDLNNCRPGLYSTLSEMLKAEKVTQTLQTT